MILEAYELFTSLLRLKKGTCIVCLYYVFLSWIAHLEQWVHPLFVFVHRKMPVLVRFMSLFYFKGMYVYMYVCIRFPFVNCTFGAMRPSSFCILNRKVSVSIMKEKHLKWFGSLGQCTFRKVHEFIAFFF